MKDAGVLIGGNDAGRPAWVLGTLEDGLYQVKTGTFCAGFVVEGGRVERCAPILRARLYDYWMGRAKRVGR